MGVTDRALRYVAFLAMTYVALIFTTGRTGSRKLLPLQPRLQGDSEYQLFVTLASEEHHCCESLKTWAWLMYAIIGNFGHACSIDNNSHI